MFIPQRIIPGAPDPVRILIRKTPGIAEFFLKININITGSLLGIPVEQLASEFNLYC
jgi:hypothetical protein